jgi:hypothetical protein
MRVGRDVPVLEVPDVASVELGSLRLIELIRHVFEAEEALACLRLMVQQIYLGLADAQLE